MTLQDNYIDTKTDKYAYQPYTGPRVPNHRVKLPLTLPGAEALKIWALYQLEQMSNKNDELVKLINREAGRVL